MFEVFKWYMYLSLTLMLGIFISMAMNDWMVYTKCKLPDPKFPYSLSLPLTRFGGSWGPGWFMLLFLLPIVNFITIATVLFVWVNNSVPEEARRRAYEWFCTKKAKKAIREREYLKLLLEQSLEFPHLESTFAEQVREVIREPIVDLPDGYRVRVHSNELLFINPNQELVFSRRITEMEFYLIRQYVIAVGRASQLAI